MALLIAFLLSAPTVAEEKPDKPADAKATDAPAESFEAPCLTDPAGQPCPTPIKGSDIPRFGENSPFDPNYKPPVIKEGRRMWADSWRWAKAPELEVEKWLTDKPDTKGKYVLIEFWATWCPPCRRSLALLNDFHEKFGDELVVIGISHEPEADVRGLTEKYDNVEAIKFYSAIDTQARTKNKLGVFGIPHVILLEPDGYVIWEGFPLLKDYELTEEIIEKVVAVGRKLKAARQSQ